jgi:hypothetical protein
MTQVWVVRYDEGLYLFGNLDAVEWSVKMMYESSVVEKQMLSDQHYRFLVLNGDRPQDTIQATLFDVHDEATVIHRFVTEIDAPEDYDRPPQKPPRQEF